MGAVGLLAGRRRSARYALARIAAGDYDGLIDRWAAEIARYRRPVMLRFAPEMNGNWLPWSTGVNGNRPGDYVAAWRHVRERFQLAGAANAVWVWNPIVAYAGSTPLRELFPGVHEVDWLAVDGYNWGNLHASGWQSYDDIFASTVHAFRALAPARPVMIAETASAPGRRQPAWVTPARCAAPAPTPSPRSVWFEFDKETDWRLAGRPRHRSGRPGRARATVDGNRAENLDEVHLRTRSSVSTRAQLPCPRPRPASSPSCSRPPTRRRMPWQTSGGGDRTRM